MNLTCNLCHQPFHLDLTSELMVRFKVQPNELEDMDFTCDNCFGRMMLAVAESCGPADETAPPGTTVH